MRDFINAVQNSGGAAAIAGAASGQLIIGVVGLVFMIGFGMFGAWLRWRDSKSLRLALERGDLTEAVRIRSK